MSTLSEKLGNHKEPWMIKGVASKTRQLAVAAAANQKQSLSNWLTRAICFQALGDSQPDCTQARTELWAAWQMEMDAHLAKSLRSYTGGTTEARGPDPTASPPRFK